MCVRRSVTGMPPIACCGRRARPDGRRAHAGAGLKTAAPGGWPQRLPCWPPWSPWPPVARKRPPAAAAARSEDRRPGAAHRFSRPVRRARSAAADLAVDEIRKAAAKAGAQHKVTITHVDYRSAPTQAVDYAEKFVEGLELPGRPVGRGPCRAGRDEGRDPGQGAADLAGGQRRRAVEGRGSGLREPRRTAGPLQAHALVELLDDKLRGGARGKKVNVGAFEGVQSVSPSTYTKDLMNEFEDAWTGKGGSVGREETYRADETSIDDKVKALVSGNPDAWVFFDFTDTYVGSAASSWQAKTESSRRSARSDRQPRDPAARERRAGRHQRAAWGGDQCAEPRPGRQGVRQAIQGARSSEASDVRRTAVRRGRALLPLGRRRRLDEWQGHGGQGARGERSAGPQVHLAPARPGHQSARGGPGHRLRGRLRPDQHERRRRPDGRRL